MKLCKDCQHFVDGSIPGCRSPRNGVSLVDGKPYFRSAGMARDKMYSILNDTKENKCGPDGNFFEVKEEQSLFQATKKTPWWRKFF